MTAMKILKKNGSFSEFLLQLYASKYLSIRKVFSILCPRLILRDVLIRGIEAKLSSYIPIAIIESRIAEGVYLRSDTDLAYNLCLLYRRCHMYAAIYDRQSVWLWAMRQNYLTASQIIDMKIIWVETLLRLGKNHLLNKAVDALSSTPASVKGSIFLATKFPSDNAANVVRTLSPYARKGKLKRSEVVFYLRNVADQYGLKKLMQAREEFIKRKSSLLDIDLTLLHLAYLPDDADDRNTETRRLCTQVFTHSGLTCHINSFSMHDLIVCSPSRDSMFQADELVTVIVTCFNTGRYIDIAVSSLLRQTYKNIEIIIVDDSSNDTITKERILFWAQEDDRVRAIFLDENVGTYRARNLAISLSNGTLITNHDSDDWAHPRRIENQVISICGSRNLVANQSRWFRVDEQGVPVPQPWGTYVYSNPASVLFRGEVLKELGGYEPVRMGADTELIGRMIAVYGRQKFKLLNDVLTVGLARDGALTRSGSGKINNSGTNVIRQAYIDKWRRRHLDQLQSDPQNLIRDYVRYDAEIKYTEL